MPLDTELMAGTSRHGSDWIAPDCSGQDFYALDRGLQDLLALYLPPATLASLTPHFARLGALAGGRLDELARVADRHGPVLHPRDRFGRDEDWIEYHPAYREMELVYMNSRENPTVMEWTRPAASTIAQLERIYGRAWKVGYPTSVLVGLWLLRAFTNSAKIPFPQPDPAFVVYVALLALACYVVLIFFAIVPAAAFIFAVTNPELQALVPTDASSPPTWQQGRRYCTNFVLTFLPFILSSIAFCIAVILQSSPAISLLAGLLLFPIGLWLSHEGYSLSSDRFVRATQPGKSDIPAFLALSGYASAMASTWTLAALLVGMFLAIGSQVLAPSSSILHLVWMMLGLLLWVFFSVSLALWKLLPKVAGIFGIIAFAAVGILVFGPELGGYGLRLVGLGGGIPIFMIARVVQDGATAQTPERVNGCLVLWTSSQVTIVRPLDPKIRLPRCHLNPRTVDVVNGVPVQTSVDTIKQADVIDVYSMGTR